MLGTLAGPGQQRLDLAALRVMAGVVQDHLLPHLDLRAVATELERSVTEELD